MSEERLREYLDQISSAATKACEFLANMEQEAFLRDVRTQMAVAMALVFIGENAAHILTHYPDFPIAHPEIPWMKMRDMRNLVAHDYYELELPIVFDTVEKSLPELIAQMDSLRHWRAQGE